MHLVANSALVWAGFCLFILIMLAIDLGLFNRTPKAISYKAAAIWSAVWIALAGIFAALLFGPLGREMFGPLRHVKALEFVTGYLIELSLSVDNLFVFLLIFSHFKVPPKYQHRVLYWGVLGALVMRILMILAGTELINRFHWIIYIFGAFLIYTSIKMFHEQETDIEPEDDPMVRFITRYVPITRHYERRKFFTVENGKRVGTLLLLVLIVVEVTDLVFALDSIPAIFGVTTDRFIVYTSNVFAILGLVLGFIGMKMLLPLLVKVLILAFEAAGFTNVITYVKLGENIPIGIALAIVAVVLLASVAASVIWPRKAPPIPEDTES